MDLFQLLIFFVIAMIAFQFWRFRGIAERLREFSQQYCAKHHLQYISLARVRTQFKSKQGKLDWLLTYELAFSSDGETQYVGTITSHGKRLVSIDLPAYRMPSTD